MTSVTYGGAFFELYKGDDRSMLLPSSVIKLAFTRVFLKRIRKTLCMFGTEWWTILSSNVLLGDNGEGWYARVVCISLLTVDTLQ